MIATAAAGLAVGSFLGLVSLRLPADRPVVFARSACGGCGRKLGPLDLVPVASFLALRGRCRTCRAPIPRRYPILELACAGVGVWAVLTLPGPLGLATAALGWWLVLLAVIDAEHFWLPDRLTLPLAAFGLVVAYAAGGGWALLDAVIGAAAGFLAMAGFAFAYERLRGREGLGGGDARLMAAAGAWTGWIGLPSVLLWGAGAGLAFALLRAALTRRRLEADERVPFGTFLAIGIWLTWLYGPIGLPRAGL